jgi:hypothetical protein
MAEKLSRQVEVIQADLDAAKEWFRSRSSAKLEEHFARHRLTHSPSPELEHDEIDGIVKRATDGFRADLKRILGDTAPDYRLNLAKALFEAVYGKSLIAWSDVTQAYWLAKAGAVLKALSAGKGEGRA